MDSEDLFIHISQVQFAGHDRWQNVSVQTFSDAVR